MIFFYLLVGAMPLVRHPIWAEINIAGLTLYKWVGLFAAVAAVMQFLAVPRRRRMFRSVQSRLFVVLGLLMMGSFLVGGSSVAIEQSPFGNWSSFIGLFFMMSILLVSRRRLRWATSTGRSRCRRTWRRLCVAAQRPIGAGKLWCERAVRLLRV